MFLLSRSLKWYSFQQVLQANSGVKYLQTRRSFQTRKKGVCKLVAGRWHDKSSCEISGLGFSSTHSYVRIKSIVSGNLVATHTGLICCWLVSVAFMGSIIYLYLLPVKSKPNVFNFHEKREKVRWFIECVCRFSQVYKATTVCPLSTLLCT
jgi:hypothetical protein